MKKSLLALLVALGGVSPFALAEQSQVTLTKVSLNKVFTSNSINPILQNDGAIYGVLNVYNSNLSVADTIINKQLPDGKVITTGKIPHPDIIKLSNDPSNNPVSFGVNKYGTIIVAYPYYNAQSKYQFVFYKFKNNQWIRLPDLLDANTDISIKKIFIDDNENIYFFTRDNFRFYQLKGDSWQVMENLANDSKYEVYRENIFNINNDNVYTSGVDKKSNAFRVYKYGKDGLNYSDGVSLGQNEYAPTCSTIASNGNVITAFVFNHQNLPKKSIRFQVAKLNHQSSGIQDSTGVSNNSLIGSIFSLGKAVTSIASGGSKESSDMIQAIAGQEIDLSSYNLTTYEPQCVSVGDNSYFLITGYNSNDMGVNYYKLTVSNKSN